MTSAASQAMGWGFCRPRCIPHEPWTHPYTLSSLTCHTPSRLACSSAHLPSVGRNQLQPLENSLEPCASHLTLKPPATCRGGSALHRAAAAVPTCPCSCALAGWRQWHRGVFTHAPALSPAMQPCSRDLSMHLQLCLQGCAGGSGCLAVPPAPPELAVCRAFSSASSGLRAREH